MESLSYLPVDYSGLLSKAIDKGFPSLGTDTLDNILARAHKDGTMKKNV